MAMSVASFATRTWTRREYDRLIQLGLLHEDEPVELLAGHLVISEPQNDPHATAIELTAEGLRIGFGPGWRVRVQLPLALGRASEPEPDVAVIHGAIRDRRSGHPTRAVLVIEVADASLRLDRVLKSAIYAGAGIIEYWIVNLVDRSLEVYRDPRRGRRGTYANVRVMAPREVVGPLAAPRARIRVADLLP